jgi:NAD+ kinase
VKIAIFGRNFNPDFKRYILEFFDNLSGNGIKFVIYKPFHDFLVSQAECRFNNTQVFNTATDTPDDIDFMVSIGGDGTFLESIMFLKNISIPVIGLNSGRLGFLANISKEEISLAFDAIIKGNYELESRSLLTLETKTSIFGNFNFALNDVTIQKNEFNNDYD